MMFLPVLGAIGLMLWVNVKIVATFKKTNVGKGWWFALILSWIFGGAIGFWSGFCFEYQPSPRLRVFGFPVPVSFFHLEGPPGEERWDDFITPSPFLYAWSNVVIFALLMACLLGLAFWLSLKSRTKTA
jgi:hypothetical protein